MKNYNQRRIIVLILLLFSFAMIISSSYAADIVVNSSSTFKEDVLNADSGSTIILNAGQEYKLNFDQNSLIINKKVIIKSSSSSKNAIINLNGKGPAFRLIGADKLYKIPRGEVTLINVTIINAGNIAIENGGGKLTVIGCTFKNNKVGDGGGGGAIYLGRGSITKFTSCTFINNKAMFGGAIVNQEKSTLTMTKCIFKNNKASRGDGGAICNNGGTMKLTSCTFIANTAYYNGGAIDVSGESTLIKCTFKNNKAGAYGGAIINGRKTLVLKDSTFTNNQAKKFGGAIAGFQYPPYGCYLKIYNTKFIKNKVTSKRTYSAIYLLETKITKSKVKITPKEGKRY